MAMYFHNNLFHVEKNVTPQKKSDEVLCKTTPPLH